MNIIHVLRAPVGGLFRHVIDLSAEQAARGHRVGLIADNQTGDAHAEATLGKLAPDLALGVTRIPMRRQPGPGDAFGVWHVARRLRATRADVVHGHGAKGGALARLAPATGSIVRAYTPHGGSLHGAVAGKLHILLERLLMRRGNLYLFESAFAYDAFRRKVGNPPGIARVVHNGLRPDEFQPVATDATAGDLVFVGELRALKGVDVLIDAVGRLRADGRTVTAAIVGDGPDASAFRARADRLGLADVLRFHAPMPARAAFALGRIVVLPSRAESLPYVALEAAAAGKPLIATRVGGVPEIFGPLCSALVAPDDAGELAQAIAGVLDDADDARETAQELRARGAAGFSVEVMADTILSAYQQVRASQRDLGGQPSAKDTMTRLWRPTP
jgi:glycosyltransferase involved in cell wall biosynthesis